MRKLSIFIGLVTVLGLIIWGVLRFEPNYQKDRTEEEGSELDVNCDNNSNSNKLIAYNLATYFVKKSLKEPTTTEFPNSKEKLKHIKYLGHKRYRVDSWVDSQDTYGAMTRRRFSCIFKRDGSRVRKEIFSIEEYGYIPNKK